MRLEFNTLSKHTVEPWEVSAETRRRLIWFGRPAMKSSVLKNCAAETKEEAVWQARHARSQSEGCGTLPFKKGLVFDAVRQALRNWAIRRQVHLHSDLVHKVVLVLTDATSLHGLPGKKQATLQHVREPQDATTNFKAYVKTNPPRIKERTL